MQSQTEGANLLASRKTDTIRSLTTANPCRWLRAQGEFLWPRNKAKLIYLRLSPKTSARMPLTLRHCSRAGAGSGRCSRIRSRRPADAEHRHHAGVLSRPQVPSPRNDERRVGLCRRSDDQLPPADALAEPDVHPQGARGSAAVRRPVLRVGRAVS